MRQMRQMRRTRRARSDGKMLVYGGGLMSAALIFFSIQSPTQPSNENSVAVPAPTVEVQNIETVNPGKPESAIAYYHETLTELGLNLNNLPPAQLVTSMTLSQVMDHLDYPKLDLKDVEDLPSVELMKQFPGDVLSSAFFAPKITDVSANPITPGWRKLVRFKAKGELLDKGISAGYLLFNKFQPDYDKDPFGDKSEESQNTQLILTRAKDAKLDYPIYFLVFGRRLTGSKLITFLTATFDARAPNIVSKNQYFVPNACAHCHGGLKNELPDYDKLKLNFLDTDHWIDRTQKIVGTQKKDDFAFLNDHNCGKPYRCAVLYDGGNTKPEFEAAFDVIRVLNREIQDQNKSVLPTQSFQLRAVSKWLELHDTDSKHQAVFARALPPLVSGDDIWKESNQTDKTLLPLLNRYCYRCHSSLKFNIFDKPAVVIRAGTILKYMNRAIDDPLKMPQDRNLDCSDQSFDDRRTILKLIEPWVTPTPTPTP